MYSYIHTHATYTSPRPFQKQEKSPALNVVICLVPSCSDARLVPAIDSDNRDWHLHTLSSQLDRSESDAVVNLTKLLCTLVIGLIERSHEQTSQRTSLNRDHLVRSTSTASLLLRRHVVLCVSKLRSRSCWSRQCGDQSLTKIKSGAIEYCRRPAIWPRFGACCSFLELECTSYTVVRRHRRRSTSERTNIHIIEKRTYLFPCDVHSPFLSWME